MKYIESENAIFKFKGIVWALRYEANHKPMLEIEYEDRTLKTVFSNQADRDKIYTLIVDALTKEKEDGI